ncbi:hypothetical protein BGX28_000627 [Mortierella sp. GBA30]|nr:hypothetical protein BGX28_000627 [Mortierella sp. GBA30]
MAFGSYSMTRATLFLVFILIGILSTPFSVAQIPDGRYAIKRSKNEFLSDSGGNPQDRAVLDGYNSKYRFSHQWLISRNSDNLTVNIRSAELPVYLSVDQRSVPGANSQVQMAAESQKWLMIGGSEPGQYFIQFSGGEADDAYVIDVSDESSSPPSIVLQRKSTQDEHQTWELHAVIRP